MFTNQQTFTLVRNHLLKQGKKATDDRGNCRYLIDGLKCAAGCLIPEGQYNPAFEKKEVHQVIIENGFSDWFGHNKRIVEVLQYIHDCYPSHEWAQRLSDLEGGWSLFKS